MRPAYLPLRARLAGAALAVTLPVLMSAIISATFQWSSDSLAVLSMIGLPVAYGAVYFAVCGAIAAIFGIWPAPYSSRHRR